MTRKVLIGTTDELNRAVTDLCAGRLMRELPNAAILAPLPLIDLQRATIVNGECRTAGVTGVKTPGGVDAQDTATDGGVAAKGVTVGQNRGASTALHKTALPTNDTRQRLGGSRAHVKQCPSLHLNVASV